MPLQLQTSLLNPERLSWDELEESLSVAGAMPNLLVLHGSASAEEELVRVAEFAKRAFPSVEVIGCTAEGVIANSEEHEEVEAIACLSMSLPAADLTTVNLEFLATREGHAYVGWPDRSDLWSGVRGVLALGDPFSFPIDAWLERMGEAGAEFPIIGGMCSGGHEPGGSCLIWNGQVIRKGAVIALLRGDFEISTVVSQGCRAIGSPCTVTASDLNVLLELDGKPALSYLHELFMTLPTKEQESFRHGLQVGILVEESSHPDGTPPLLARNVVGCDSDSQGVVVSERLLQGQQIQFQLRDEVTATEDLRMQLHEAAQRLSEPPAGGLLYSCNGRGTRLFSTPHHDPLLVQKQWPGLPVIGCQAAGEIGPIGKRSFLHGHTAALALFHS